MNRKQIIIVALFCIGWGVATIVLNSDRSTGGEARHIFPRQAQVQPSASSTIGTTGGASLQPAARQAFASVMRLQSVGGPSSAGTQ